MVIADLKQSLISPDEDFVVARDMDEEASTRAISQEEMSQIKRKSQHRDDYEEQMRLNSQYTRPPQNEEYGEEEYEEEDDYDAGDGRMEKVTTLLAVIAGVIICVIILVLAGKILGIMSVDDIGNKIGTETGESSGMMQPENPSQGSSSSPDDTLTVQMVDVLGWNVEDAKKEIVRIGLVPEVSMVESDIYEENTVISTDILSGDEVEVNSTVVLTVSAGAGAVDVPEVEGLTYEEAYNKITMEGFTVSRTESYSATVEKGRVISQSPAGGESVSKGSVINLNVSLGVESNTIAMPNMIGWEQIEAEERRTEELEQRKKYVGTDQYIEEIARDRLGLIDPDEVLIQADDD